MNSKITKLFSWLAVPTIFIVIMWAGIKQISTSQKPGNDNSVPGNPNSVVEKNISEIVPPGPKNKTIQDRISFGEKLLVPKEELGSKNTEFRAAKQRGVEAMAAGNYEEAAIQFEKAIEKYRNAPETLIYLNNARIGSEKSYTIALSVPIGSDLNGALEMLRGVAQAQNEINQNGGINGVPLKVAIADDEENPGIAQQIADELTKNSEILAVVGHYASDTTLAAGKIYDRQKLVAISPVSTSVKLSDFSNYVFRTVPSDSIAARKLSNYIMTQMRLKKAAVFFNSQSAYSRSLKTEFVIAVFAEGGEVVAEFDFSEPGFKVRQSVNQAFNKGAEVLMLAPNLGKIDEALQVVQVNNKRLPLLGGDDVYTPKTVEISGNLSEGMILAVPWHIDNAPDRDFPSRSKELWNAEVNWRTALAYDATQALIAALKRSPNPPTRVTIQQVLSAEDFSVSGASGSIQFFPWGDRKGLVQLVEVVLRGYDDDGNPEYGFAPRRPRSP